MQDDDIERTESGDPIYRYAERERSWTPPKHHGANLEEIEAHLEQHIARPDWVFHEIISDLIHLDILVINATPERPFHLLVTSGVSDEPMNVPAGAEAFNRVELLIALPPDWPLSQQDLKDEANYWPLGWLKVVGRLPHEYDSWIGWGHTIPNGDPADPIANTSFIGVMLSIAECLGHEASQLTTQAGETITFYSLLPLYPEEMDFKLKHGAEALEEKFQKLELSFVLDVERPNVVKKKRRWW